MTKILFLRSTQRIVLSIFLACALAVPFGAVFGQTPMVSGTLPPNAPPAVQHAGLPNPGILPDSPFYVFKHTWENVVTFFTFGDSNKAARHFDLAQTRLAEAEALVAKGPSTSSAMQTTFDRYESELQETQKYMQQAEAGGKDMNALAKKILTILPISPSSGSAPSSSVSRSATPSGSQQVPSGISTAEQKVAANVPAQSAAEKSLARAAQQIVEKHTETSSQDCTGAAQMPTYGDNAYFTTSSDPNSWPEGTLIMQHASVPEIIELTANIGTFQKGDLLVYFVDTSCAAKAGTETLALISSKDGGKTWSGKTPVTVNNKPNKGATVDPSVVQLQDGRLRLYFFGSEVTAAGTGVSGQKGDHSNKAYSATSSDGISFDAESGVRFQDSNLTDPEVIWYQNKWYAYYSVGSSSKLATSSDGLTFQSEQVSGTDKAGGVPGAVVVGGGVLLYGCSTHGLATAFASDGKTFTAKASNIFATANGACDPSVIQSASGGYKMVYKINSSKKTGGQTGASGTGQQSGGMQQGVMQQPGSVPPQQSQQPQGTFQQPSGGFQQPPGGNLQPRQPQQQGGGMYP